MKIKAGYILEAYGFFITTTVFVHKVNKQTFLIIDKDSFYDYEYNRQQVKPIIITDIFCRSAYKTFYP